MTQKRSLEADTKNKASEIDLFALLYAVLDKVYQGEKIKLPQGRSLKEDMRSKAPEIDLFALFYAILDKVKLIIVAAGIGALIMAVYSVVLAQPVYEATSKLYVMNQQDSAINLSDLQIGTYLTLDYQEVFDTWEVQEMVLQNLGLNCTRKELRDMVEIENPPSTRMLYITASSSDPEEATKIANEFAMVAQAYISDTMDTDEPSLMSQALVPSDPVAPRKVFNTMLGGLLGGLLAIIVIAIRYMLDDRIRTAEDVRHWADIPTLAIVPNNGENNEFEN